MFILFCGILFKEVEIDIFYVKPNIIRETTLKVTDIEKIRFFIRKIQFIEKMYKDKFQKYFFCYSINDLIKADVESKYAVKSTVVKL